MKKFKRVNEYRNNLIEFLFSKDYKDFLLHDYFEYYRKNYLTHNKKIKNRGYCLDSGYRSYDCEFCSWLPYTKKTVSKFNFYFDKEIRELLLEME